MDFIRADSLQASRARRQAIQASRGSNANYYAQRYAALTFVPLVLPVLAVEPSSRDNYNYYYDDDDVCHVRCCCGGECPVM